MELVQDRTAATLLAIISAHVAPGTEIWSDQWASYHNVGRIPGVTAHHTVNHSIQFVTGKFIYYQGSVDLILHCFIASGVHTNTVERCKTKIKRMKGVHRSFLPSYLDEFLWRERWGGSTEAAFHNIVSDIATQYVYPLP